MHRKHIEHERYCSQNNQLSTKSLIELKDNSIVVKMFLTRVILELNMTFGQELIDLHTTRPIIAGHVWRQCGGLDVKHSISVHSWSNSIWHAKKVLK